MVSPRTCWPTHCLQPVPTSVKLLGEAAQRLTVVSGHSCNTSLVFSSTRITESLVIPSRRGTSLFLPFIFSWNRRYKESVLFLWIHLIFPSYQWCDFLPVVNLHHCFKIGRVRQMTRKLKGWKLKQSYQKTGRIHRDWKDPQVFSAERYCPGGQAAPKTETVTEKTYPEKKKLKWTPSSHLSE